MPSVGLLLAGAGQVARAGTVLTPLFGRRAQVNSVRAQKG